MTEDLEKYKQFKGIECRNIGWRAEFLKEKLYTFEIRKENKTGLEILARITTSTRRIMEKTLDITGAPFGDWGELIVKAVDAWNSSIVEDYANRTARDNAWTRAPREAIWIGQECDFTISEEERCDLKLTIRVKEGKALPDRSKDSERWSYGDKVRIPGVKLYKVERRGKREGYQDVEGYWVAWAKQQDPQPQRRIPNWQPICYIRTTRTVACGNAQDAISTQRIQRVKSATPHI